MCSRRYVKQIWPIGLKGNGLSNTAAIYAVSAIFLKGLSFFVTFWVAKTLTIDEFASWGLLFALQAGVASFSGIGIFEALASLSAVNGSKFDKFSNVIFPAFISSAAIVCAIGLLAAYFTDLYKYDLLVLSCAILSGVLLSLCSLNSQVSRLNLHNYKSLIYSFLLPAISMIGAVGAFFCIKTLESFFFGGTLGFVSGFLVLLLFRAAFPVKPTLNFLNSELLFSVVVRMVPYFVIAIFGWLSGYGNTFIISKIFEPDEIARYTFAMSVAAILQLVASAVNQVWTPQFLQLYSSEPSNVVAQKANYVSFAQGLALGTIALVCMVFLPKAFSWIGGNLSSYVSMNSEMFFLFSGYISLIPWWFCQNYILVNDSGVNLMRLTIATGFLGIAVWVFCMVYFGSLGIYIGFFLQMALRSVAISFVCHRTLGVYPEAFGPILGLCIATFGFILVGF